MMDTYSWYEWLAFFYIYCVCGWICESAYVSLRERRFVNRGFLRVPMLPLYGTGAVMMLWFTLPVRDHLFFVYLNGMIGATALEYVTGYMMERLFKVRYWDYSSKKFQLHSYICLSSSIAWGFLTILMTEVIHRPVSILVLGIKPVYLMALLSIISVFFLADVYKSTKAALLLGRTLEAMTKLRHEIDELQKNITALKEETTQRFMEIKEETAQRLAEKKEAAELRIAEFKEDTIHRIAGKSQELQELVLLHRHLQELIEKYSALKKHHSLYLKSLLKRNPGAVSAKFSQAMKDLRDGLKSPEGKDKE